MTDISFAPGDGAPFTKEAASIVAAEINRIASENGGTATPKDVLTAARKKMSPLHRYFEWNNTKAAEAYRLHQARQLIRTIEIVRISGEDTQRTRAFHVMRDGDGPKGYMPTEAILARPDLTDTLVKRAQAEAASWHARYRRLRDFAGLSEVFTAIETAGIVKQVPAPRKAWRDAVKDAVPALDQAAE